MSRLCYNCPCVAVLGRRCLKKIRNIQRLIIVLVCVRRTAHHTIMVVVKHYVPFAGLPFTNLKFSHGIIMRRFIKSQRWIGQRLYSSGNSP